MKCIRIIKASGVVALIAFALHANAQSSDSAASPAAPTAASSKAANRALAKKVHRALAKAKGLDPSHIYVKVVDGAVTLTGSANTQAEIDLATKAVQGVDGVTSVNNRLTVRAPT